MPVPQTVAGAYAKIEAHEDLCAERYANIHTSMDETSANIKNLYNLAWKATCAIVALLVTIVISLANAFYGLQTSHDNQKRIQAVAPQI